MIGFERVVIGRQSSADPACGLLPQHLFADPSMLLTEATMTEIPEVKSEAAAAFPTE